MGLPRKRSTRWLSTRAPRRKEPACQEFPTSTTAALCFLFYTQLAGAFVTAGSDLTALCVHDAGQRQTQLLALLSAAASETAADAAHGPFVAAPSREDWTHVASSIDGITSSGEDERWARLLGEDQGSMATRRDSLEGLWKCVRNSCCWLILDCCTPCRERIWLLLHIGSHGIRRE